MSLTLRLSTSLALLLAVPATGFSQGAGEPARDPQAAPPAPGPPAQIVRPPMALVGAVVHRMDGSTPRQEVVLIEGGRIIGIGEDMEVPEGIAVIDLEGFHLVPGLIDAAVRHDREHDALYISHGVTMVRDMGSPLNIINERREAERERIPGPALFVAGPLLDGPGSAAQHAMLFDATEEVDPMLTGLASHLTGLADRDQLESDAYGLDYLATGPLLTADVLGEVLRVGHELGLAVWGPLPTQVPLSAAVELGLDGVFDLSSLLPSGSSWAEVTDETLDESIAIMAAGTTAITPRAYNILRQTRPLGELESRLRQLSPVYEELWLADRVATEGLQSSEGIRPILARLNRLVLHGMSRLHEENVALVPGSGAPYAGLFPGGGLIDEMEAWVEAGIPPADVLFAATARAADVLGVADQRGRLQEGSVADLVALGADPRSTLGGFRDPELVVLRGRLLERDDLYSLVEATIELQDGARELMAQPVRADLPSLRELEGAELLLDGHAENLAFTRRISGERFGVYRLPDGRLGYAARVVIPESFQRSEMHVELLQVFKGDLLDEFCFLVTPQVGDFPEEDRSRYLIWEVRGVLVESTGLMSIQRRTQHGALPTGAAPDPISLVDFSDTLTAMILARHGREGLLYSLRIEGETYEPVLDRLGFQLEEGELRFASASGQQGVFRVDSRGVPLALTRRAPSGVTSLRIQEVDQAPNNSGLPPIPTPRITVEAGAAEAADDQGGAPREGSAPRDR